MLDNKVLSMTPGEALLDVPIGDIIEKLAIGIAEAQLRLDQMGVRVATMLAEAEVSFTDKDGKSTKKNLLQLGFAPNFYHFTQAEIEVKLTMSMKVEEGFSLGAKFTVGSGSPPSGGSSSPPGGNTGNRAVMWGLSIDASYHRKYEFDMSGSSRITTTMVSVPAPPAFIDQIRQAANLSVAES